MILGYKTFITASEMAGRLAHRLPTIVIDTRFALSDTNYGRRSYRSGHIPGAIYAHLDKDLSGPIIPGRSGRHPLPEPERFVDKLCQWGLENGTQVVVYDDDNGGIAARLWWMLRWVGHDLVAVLDGGWRAWMQQGGPTETGAPPPAAPAKFKPNLRPELFLSGEEVMTMRNSGAIQLFDARTPDRFAGDNETIDPVAGHIPGAVNASYKDTANEDGTTRSAEALRAWLHHKLGSTSPNQAVFYCGSGVTACRSVLAMEHAGLSGSRVYAGSWSEWIRISSEVAAGAE